MTNQKQEIVLTLQELLEEIRKRKLLFLEDGSLWGPESRSSAVVERAIEHHCATLKILLDLGEIHFCYNADLHRRRGWTYAGRCKYGLAQLFICDTCQRLQRHMQRTKKGAA